LAVSQDPELLANLQEQFDLTDQIVTKYGSFDAVHTTDDSLLSRMPQLKSRYIDQESYLTKKQFEAKWLSHFDVADRVGHAEHHNSGSVPQEVLEASLDKLVLEREKDDEQSHKYIQNIDPALLTEHTEYFLGESGVSHLLDDLREASSDDIISMDDIQPEFSAETVLDIGNVDEVQARKSRKSKYRFGHRPIRRYSLFHGITDLLYNQPPNLTATALSNTCVNIFNHNHVADRFYPIQEPLPGTMDCSILWKNSYLSAGGC
jgi:hypothetical protein